MILWQLKMEFFQIKHQNNDIISAELRFMLQIVSVPAMIANTIKDIIPSNFCETLLRVELSH